MNENTIKILSSLIISDVRGMFDPEDFVCRFYATRGFCMDEDHCYLPHENEVGRVRDNVCRHFLHGYCKFGLTCINDHVFFKTVRGKNYMYVKEEQLLERAMCFARVFYAFLGENPQDSPLAAQVLARSNAIFYKLTQPEKLYELSPEYHVGYDETCKKVFGGIIKAIETNEPDYTVLHEDRFMRSSFDKFFNNFTKYRIKEQIMSGDYSAYEIAGLPVPEVEFSPTSEGNEDNVDVSSISH